MKIRTQLIAGIVVFALLLALLFAFVLVTDRQVEHLAVQEEMANNIALEVGELGYLSNDYILYREPRQAERWNAKYEAIGRAIANLSVDQPEQRAIAGSLAANLKNTRSVFDDIVAGTPGTGSPETAFIQLSWSRMAVQNQGMIFDAGRLANLIRDEADATRQARLFLIIALMGAFVAFLLTSYFIFYRKTLKSIAVLQEGSRNIGSGNLGYEIPVSSDDEIAELSLSFNRMTADLRKVTASKADLEHEIAGRKLAEEDLVRANRELGRSEADLIQRNVDLSALNEELTATQEELEQNVDELTRAEKELRETSQYLQNLITYANAPIIVWDPAFRITRFNHAFELLTGLSAGGVIGQHLKILFPPQHCAAAMDVINRTIGGERLDVVEIPILRKDGSIRVVLWNSATLYEADGTTVSSTIAQGQDITDRKIAEEENLRAREEWERTFDTVPDLIAILDTHHRILRANRAMADRLGITPGDCVGKLCHIAVHGTNEPPAFCPHTMTCADGKQHICEVSEPGLGGSFIVSTTPLSGPDGALIGTVHVAHDITDRKRAEAEVLAKNRALNEANEALSEIHEELRSANDELVANERLLVLRNEELTALNEELIATQDELRNNVAELNRSGEELRRNEAQLKDALAEKEILLSEIHHRVKNNLTAFISLLSLEGTYEDSEEGRSLKKDLQNRARSMALIHETLYRTKKYSSVDMDVYLTTLTDQIAASYHAAGPVRIIVEAKAVVLDLPRATPCGLIINELVTNSYKYAFPASFDCTEKRGEPCTIRVSLSLSGGQYTLSVSDNGAGLPADFDPLSAKSLGLKLVNFLAKHQLRASVAIRSEHGTEFLIRFAENAPGNAPGL